ncbi:MAG: alpha/beta hydrolase [Polyangiales bacterium]
MDWEWIVIVAVAVAGLWWISSAFARRRIVASLGDPVAARTGTEDTASAQNGEVLRLIADFGHTAKSGPLSARIHAVRAGMDAFGGELNRDPEALGVRVDEVDVDGIPGEWVRAPHADPDRRLLYLHGGAFFVGSRLSHRPLTAELAKRTGLSVLVVDYRLLPEHKRVNGIIDCQSAYRWILQRGPDADGEPSKVFVAGDSAGGNLTLMLTWWIRDQKLRQVDGAVALSPATDSTFQSPSLRTNAPSDPMLGPDLGRLLKLPRWLLLFLTAIAARMSPRNPLISPFHADLSNLPPTLVQASECEMLFDDARRYTHKARLAGSPVTLQTWAGMVHVWQFFHGVLPEARDALDHIAAFLGEGGAAKRQDPALLDRHHL